MKKFNLIPFLAASASLFASSQARAQGGFAFQQYAYARQHTSTSSIRPLRVQADRYENTYVLGYYEQNATFSGSVTLSAPGPQLYLAKFDPQGSPVWAKNLTGTRSFARRGAEVAALFVSQEGESYVSLLIDSSRSVAGSTIAVPAGQRVATISKIDAFGNIFFSKPVANGVGLSMPDYRPLCADASGNIYYALNVRAGTQVRYGPKIGAFTGVQPMLVRLANTGNYAASIVPEVKAQNRTYQGLFTAISCNERKVYIGGMVLDTLVLRDETGGRRTYPNTPGVAGEEWRFMYCMELDKATGKLSRYTERNNVNRVYGQYAGTTWIYDVTARPDSGCYFIYPSYAESQGQSGSSVSDNYNLISGAFGANLTTGIRTQEFNYYDGFFDHKDEYYRFDKIHYSATDNTLLVLARTGEAFTPNSLDYVDSRPALVTSVNLSSGQQEGTISVINRADACPIPGPASFAAVGTVGGSTGLADDTARFKNIVLLNTSTQTYGYLARYAGTPSPATVITSFSPATGRAGDWVVIKGKGFGRVYALTFNGTKVNTYYRNNDSTLRAMVPVGATTGPIAIYASAGSPVSDSSFVISSQVNAGTRMAGLEDVVQGRLSLSPNPASSEVMVTGLDGDKPLVLSDISGRVLLQVSPNSNGSARLSISSLKPGMYLVRQGARTERLVKE